MKKLWASIALIVALLVTVWLYGQAAEMISEKANSAVIAGIGLILLMVGVWGSMIVFLIKHYPKSRQLLVLMVLSLPLFGMTACTKVSPGWVGIKVNQYGSQKGVQDFPLQTGRVWYNVFTEDVYEFPTFMQNRLWNEKNGEMIMFNSIEGAQVGFDVSINYKFEAEKVPHIFVEFRKDADVITDTYVHNQVRDTFTRLTSKMKAVDIIGMRKAELEDDVNKEVTKNLAQKGFVIDRISVVGSPHVDDKVQAAINNVIQASQDAQAAEQKVRQAKAEADQKIEEARGNAASYKLQVTNLTPNILKKMAIEKWDGHFPQVMGSGTLPFINLKDLGNGAAPVKAEEQAAESK